MDSEMPSEEHLSEVSVGKGTAGSSGGNGIAIDQKSPPWLLMRTKSDPSTLIPEPGSLCVYLGASSGSTVSHLHDHICGAGNHHDGKIIAVDISSRMMRDLVIMCETRPGIIPVLADARHPLSVAQYLQRKSDWLFQDLSMPDQAKSFIESTSKLLTEGGLGIISIKAASERWAPGRRTTLR